MRRLSLGPIAAVSVIAFTQIASAADLPRKVPPPPPPPPVYSWTGFYVGGNVGYSWGRADTDLSGNAVLTQAVGLPFQVTNSPSPFADSSKQSLNGIIGGGQIGLNYQFSPKWVLGFEFDFQGSDERKSSTVSDPFTATFCGVINPGPPATCVTPFPTASTATTTYNAKIDWFGTARGRLGFLVTDQLLLYATGGLAYGEVKLSGLTSVNFTGTAATGSAAFSGSSTNLGWTVGGGIEGKFSGWFSPAWSWKLEYLYIDLGSLDTVTPSGPPTLFVSTITTIGPLTTHTRFTDNIVRVGLNYKLF